MNPINRLILSGSILIGSLLPALAQKPILPDFHADPSARVFNGKLYIYPSHDIAGMKNWDMVDWHVFSSDDMKKWTDHGVIFKLEDTTWAKKEAWAPDCIGRNGKYYFYFTAGGQIGVAVGDTPTGPFKDALGRLLLKKGEAGIKYCIDPNIFIDDDGQAYLYYGGARQVGVVKLKEDMITRDGPVQVLDMPKFYEGVWIHKHNGIYYASYPTRESQETQANVLVYSMAKSPLGPWEYKGEIIDNHSPNVHGSITEFKGQAYLFYHVAASPDKRERQTCVEPLFYNEDGTIKPLEMSKSNPAADGAKTANPTPPSAPLPTFANIPYGEHPREVLDFYKAPADKPTPVVIYMHGGAWVTGDKESVRKTKFARYLDAGISVVSLSYRYVSQARQAGVKPPVKWPMEDAMRALQFVRSNAAEWNIDKTHVGLSGNSAGACSSLWLTFHPDMADPMSSDPVARESTRVTAAAVDGAQTSLDPQQMKEWIPNSRYGQQAFGFPDGGGKDPKVSEANFANFLVHREEALQWIREYSPYELASADDPAIYLIYSGAPTFGQGEKNPTHSANFGVKLKEKLDQLGVECELAYPGAPDVKHPGMEEFLIENLKK